MRRKDIVIKSFTHDDRWEAVTFDSDGTVGAQDVVGWALLEFMDADENGEPWSRDQERYTELVAMVNEYGGAYLLPADFSETFFLGIKPRAESLDEWKQAAADAYKKWNDRIKAKREAAKASKQASDAAE